MACGHADPFICVDLYAKWGGMWNWNVIIVLLYLFFWECLCVLRRDVGEKGSKEKTEFLQQPNYVFVDFYHEESFLCYWSFPYWGITMVSCAYGYKTHQLSSEWSVGYVHFWVIWYIIELFELSTYRLRFEIYFRGNFVTECKFKQFNCKNLKSFQLKILSNIN